MSLARVKELAKAGVDGSIRPDELRELWTLLPAVIEMAERAARFSWPLHRKNEEVNVELAVQRDGSRLWAIRYRGDVWTREGEWEWEPMPSGRDDAFLKRARWTFDEAISEASRISLEAQRKGREPRAP